MKTKLLFITVIHFMTISSYGTNNPIEERMQEILDKGIRKYGARGVSAAIIFSDGQTLTGVSGISHDTVVIEPDMLFVIGSVTKNIVAALALKLAEENILSLDDPLSKWLDEYPHIDNNITIRQLLNHTSGIYMFWDNQDIWDALIKRQRKGLVSENSGYKSGAGASGCLHSSGHSVTSRWGSS